MWPKRIRKDSLLDLPEEVELEQLELPFTRPEIDSEAHIRGVLADSEMRRRQTFQELSAWRLRRKKWHWIVLMNYAERFGWDASKMQGEKVWYENTETGQVKPVSGCYDLPEYRESIMRKRGQE